MTSTFLNTIPLPGDKLRVSQGNLLNNNQALNSIFSVDHDPLIDTTAAQGKHKKSTYLLQGSPPATLVDEIVVFSQDATVSLAGTPTAIATAFMRNETSGTVWPFHLVHDIPLVNPGFIQIGPLVLCWGTFTMPAGVNASYTIDATHSPLAYTFTPNTVKVLTGWVQFNEGVGGTASTVCGNFTNVGMTVASFTPDRGAATTLMSYFIIGPANA